MASKASDFVRDVATELHVDFVELPHEEADRLRKNVLAKYAQRNAKWLWSSLPACLIASDPENVIENRIGEFLGRRPAVLFFDSGESSSVFRFGVGESILLVLAECPLFEYYITNDDLGYLIAKDHHDNLYALDEAEGWLRKVKSDLGSR
jgi:hypothetical protein